MRRTRRVGTLGLVSGCLVVLVILGEACSSGRHAAPRPARTFPALDAIVKARLTALSSALLAGDPQAAVASSAGDVAVRDAASANAAAARKSAGNTTDVGFDVISLASHPLDGGATDFITYEKLRLHESGAATNSVEIYHRDSDSTPWKAAYGAIFASNIDLPAIRLDAHGSGHLLSASEMLSQHAIPDDLMKQYAAGFGTFAPGEFTSGEATYERNWLSSVDDHGAGLVQWDPQHGGVAVALADGALVFGALQRNQSLHKFALGTTSYFVVQDPKRVNYSAILDPGHYTDLAFRSSVSLAVVVTAGGSPDVVGREEEVVAAQGSRAPMS
jgi:hypothetical protein